MFLKRKQHKLQPTGTAYFEPDVIDVDLYQIDSLRELAIQFVGEGLFGDIPDNILIYFDFDKIARDLACDYSMTSIDGTNYAYRCG